MESDVIAEASSHGEIESAEAAIEKDTCPNEAKEADASKKKAGSRTAADAGLERALCSPIKKLKSQSSTINILNEESKTP